MKSSESNNKSANETSVSKASINVTFGTTPPTWYVYLAHCADKSLYCGVTNNLSRRLAQHNGDIAGGAKYTKGRRPVHYAYTHACISHSEALQLEILIKKQRTPTKKCQCIKSLASSS